MRIADNKRNNYADVDSNRMIWIPKSDNRVVRMRILLIIASASTFSSLLGSPTTSSYQPMGWLVGHPSFHFGWQIHTMRGDSTTRRLFFFFFFLFNFFFLFFLLIDFFFS
jgi:hypothetical protein